MEQFHLQNLNKLFLIITVFIGGASVMVVELVGSRLLAPFLGTSLIAWTALIGVILGSLSLGYWLGGQLADFKPSYKKLGMIILSSSLSIILLIWLSLTLKTLAPWLITNLSFIWAVVICSFVLFFLPSLIFGLITPYVLKLALVDLNKAGKISGMLYAWSTLGSIAGTFISGFVLIPFLGSFKTLISIALILGLISLLFFISYRSSVLIIIFVTAWFVFYQPTMFYPSSNTIVDQESFYNRLFITKGQDEVTKRPIISLMSGPHLGQAAQFTDQADDLVFLYAKFFRLADYFTPAIKQALMIGGGAYSIPRDFLVRHPEATMTVAEIDPLYTKLAQQYFNLKTNERLIIHHQDGRLFLNNNKTVYQVILLDAFNNAGSVPFHLATKEMVEKIYDNLSPDGVVMVNLIGSLSGDGSEFIKAEYATYAMVFKNQVKLFPLGKNPAALQNIMLVAIKNNNWPSNKLDNEELAIFLKQEQVPYEATKILTDDWAPVDYWLAKVY